MHPLRILSKMRIFFCILFCTQVLLSYSKDNDSLKNELLKLGKQIDKTKESEIKIPLYKQIIEKSFPNRLDLTFENANALLKLSKSIKNSEAEAFALLYLGQYYFISDNFERSIEFYLQALDIYQSNEDNKRLLHIYNNLGLCNQYINHYNDALTYYQRAIEIAQAMDNKNQAALSYQDIGTLYNDLQKYSLAEYYYDKALEIYREFNNDERIAAIYQNIGVLHYNWGNINQCLEYYTKSLRMYESLQDKQNIAISLSNIGLVYEETQDYQKALDYYLRALIIFEEIDFKPTLVYIFYNLGSIYMNIEEYNKSVEYFTKGLNLSKEISMKDYISYNYEALSGLYEQLGNYQKALSYYKEYTLIKDSLFNEEKHKQIQELETKFQTARQEKEIAFLKLSQELQETNLKAKESQNLVLIFSSLITLIIATSLFVLVRTQRKTNIKFKNEIEERKSAECQIDKVKRELEERIHNRTINLEEINQKLKAEIAGHRLTMENLKVAKDQAEEADRLKSDFLSNISHELQIPMNAISGFSQMLVLDGNNQSNRNEYIHLIQNSCTDLTNLIEDFVDFATIESGNINIEMREFNPHPILEYLYDYYTQEIVKKNKHNLILAYANENSENDKIIKTDASKLKQIVSILIDNAIKFTKKGHVEFGFVHPNDHEIQFFVRDTGIGIAEQNFSLIFERFRQVDEKTTKQYNGAGIGLSVAKKLVELLNGKIHIDSTINRGSTFYFNLPYNGNAEESNEKVQTSELNWDDKLILIAEDKKINFEILKETLSATNAKLLWAKNGEEAFNLVKEHEDKIDLILLDIQMPVIDGYESAKRIKAITNSIPIIAQTAYALPQDSYKCFDAGCDDYISKPISLDLFLSKLKKYLS